MAVHAFLLIAGSGIQNGPVSQHSPPFIRDVKDISVAFLALIVFKGGVSLLAIFFMIILIQNKEVHEHIFDAVCSFGIEEVKGVMGGGKMAIHTVCHESLGVICVGRGFPGVVGELNLMAHGAKLGGGGAHHGVVGDAEDGEGYYNANEYVESRLRSFLPNGHFAPRSLFCLCHNPSLGQ